MEPIRAYIVTVCGAALVCALIRHLTKQSKTFGPIVGMITGIYLALIIFAPFSSFRLGDLADKFPDISAEAQQAVNHGQETYQKELSRCIRERLETYILDKGTQLGVSLTVEVELSEDAMPVPVRVRLCGNVSPYAKSRLQQILRDELGIDKENQIWT